jgi:hypothetical protein
MGHVLHFRTIRLQSRGNRGCHLCGALHLCLRAATVLVLVPGWKEPSSGGLFPEEVWDGLGTRTGRLSSGWHRAGNWLGVGCCDSAISAAHGAPRGSLSGPDDRVSQDYSCLESKKSL